MEETSRDEQLRTVCDSKEYETGIMLQCCANNKIRKELTIIFLTLMAMGLDYRLSNYLAFLNLQLF